MNMKNALMLSFKCFLCGFAMCFPGMSGGSVAVMLGIYKTMTSCVSGLFGDLRNNIPKLANIALSCLLGWVLFAFTLGKYARIDNAAFLIFGQCIISVCCAAYFYKSLKKYSHIEKKTKIISLLSGACALIVIELLLVNTRLDVHAGNAIVLIICGLSLSLALILPGVSFSYMLLFIGIYDKVMSAVAAFDIGYLAPVAIGCAAGILVFSRVIDKLIQKYPAGSDFFIIGFTAASIAFLMP